MSVRTLNMPLLVSGIDAYISRVSQIPVLATHEEQELAESFFFQNNLTAARKLVLGNLRFVIHIARTYVGYGLALADLIQEGNIGLMKAVKRFDPKMGVRLISFAVHWIKAEIQEFILRNWRIVKVATTKAQRKLFFNLRKHKKSFSWLNKKEVDVVAQDLQVTPESVREMESRLTAQDVSLDAHAEEDGSYSSRLPVYSLADYQSDPACLIAAKDCTKQNDINIQAALAKLDVRSREIIIKRRLSEPKTKLRTLAEYYQVSAERIRQLEESALKRLRDLLEKPV